MNFFKPLAVKSLALALALSVAPAAVPANTPLVGISQAEAGHYGGGSFGGGRHYRGGRQYGGHRGFRGNRRYYRRHRGLGSGGAAIIVHFGLPDAGDVIHVPALATHTADKEIRFSWLAPGVWPTTIAMIANGLLNLEPLVSKTVPLSEAATAIINLRARKDDPIKVQITP